MLKRFYLSAAMLLLLAVVPAWSATLTVGSGKTFSTIGDCYAAASPGDTCLISDGSYTESITVTKNDITFQSETRWGAVLDGENTRTAAFDIDGASGTQVIGLHIKRYQPTTGDTGIIFIHAGASGSMIAYNKFTNNNTYAGKTSIICVRTSNHTIRGNWFEDNIGGAEQGTIFNAYASNMLIELNNFLDEFGTGSGDGPIYSIYHTGNSAHAQIKYNHFRNGLRLRFLQHDNTGHTLEHNILHSMVQLYNAQGPVVQNHVFRRNTWYGDVVCIYDYGIMSNLQDRVWIEGNLFIGTACGVIEEWGDSQNVTMTDNHQFNNTTWLCKWEGDEFTETGTTTGDPQFDTTTGWHNQLVNNKGADLNIGVWPFTRHDGTALATDDPYSGPDTSAPSLSAAYPSGPQGIHANPRELGVSAFDQSPPVVCRTDTSDVAFAAMVHEMSTSGCAGGGTHCFHVATTAATSLTYHVRCRDSRGNANATSTTIGWTEGPSSADQNAPMIGSVRHSPDPEACVEDPQEFTLTAVNVIDATTPGIQCGIYFASHESRFDHADLTTYTTMTSESGAGVSGDDFSYSTNLVCDGVTRDYRIRCWDAVTPANVSSYSEISITPPTYECAPGLGDCNEDPSDGCEVTLAEDPFNCGVCDFVCASGAQCRLGVCVDDGDPSDGGELAVDGPEGGCACSGVGSRSPGWLGLLLLFGIVRKKRAGYK